MLNDWLSLARCTFRKRRQTVCFIMLSFNYLV